MGQIQVFWLLESDKRENPIESIDFEKTKEKNSGDIAFADLRDDFRGAAGEQRQGNRRTANALGGLGETTQTRTDQIS